MHTKCVSFTKGQATVNLLVLMRNEVARSIFPVASINVLFGRKSSSASKIKTNT